MSENLLTSVIVEIEIPGDYTEQEIGVLTDHLKKIDKVCSVRVGRPYVAVQVGEFCEDNVPGLAQALQLAYSAIDCDELRDVEVSGVWYGYMLPEDCPLAEQLRAMH